MTGMGAVAVMVAITALSLFYRSCLGVIAAALHGMVRTPGELVAVRLLLGVGCAGSFMGAVTLCALWYPGNRLATMLSRVFAFSQIGTFLAATPLALSEAAIGWRWSFGAMAAITAATGLCFFFLIRDKPGTAQQPESPREVLRGLLEVWRTPGRRPP